MNKFTFKKALQVPSFIIKILPQWMTVSNREKHFYYGIYTSLFLTLLFTLGLATGMEFKDRMWGGEFDWLDWTATLLGGLIGQVIQLLIIILLINI